MSKKTFKKENVQAAVEKDTFDDAVLVHEHSGPWIDEGKYQYQQVILKEVSTGTFYCYNHSKSGSHFTEFTFSFEWDLDEIELYTVVKTTKIIEVWE